MSFDTSLKARAAQWTTSTTKRNMARRSTGLKRRLKFKNREILYFHRADDPYCQLMVQVLPELINRFDIKVKPIVVERLPANMYPDPMRYEAYSILDAVRLGELYGIGFPANATVPDHLSSRMANNFLAEHQDSDDFFRLAADIGSALWRRGVVTLQKICGEAKIYHDARLRENEAKLKAVGHYASGVLCYGDELYMGLDRLDHLELRLRSEGLGDGQLHYNLTKRWMREVVEDPMDADSELVELYFSVRSPYSYLAIEKLHYLMEYTGCQVRLKPVLPMVMRGLRVPTNKAQYILDDTAREAQVAGLPFGRIVDPLGLATRRAMVIGFWAISIGKGMQFFRAFTQAHWAKGLDTTDDRAMERLLEEAGLPVLAGMGALGDQTWEAKAEENRVNLLRRGHWGVPVLVHEGEVLWGQDRFFSVVQAFRANLK